MSHLRGEWSADLVKYIVETVVSLQEYYKLFRSTRQGKWHISRDFLWHDIDNAILSFHIWLNFTASF